MTNHNYRKLLLLPLFRPSRNAFIFCRDKKITVRGLLSRHQNWKNVTIPQNKPRTWDMVDDWSISNLTKIHLSLCGFSFARFLVSPKFVEFCMKKKCWCPSSQMFKNVKAPEDLISDETKTSEGLIIFDFGKWRHMATGHICKYWYTKVLRNVLKELEWKKILHWNQGEKG